LFFRSWLAEKETLMRKVQFMEHYGLAPSKSSSAEMGGFFTDRRAAGRIAGDQAVQRQIQKLNVSLLKRCLEFGH
jgi:hypothetical protein